MHLYSIVLHLVLSPTPAPRLCMRSGAKDQGAGSGQRTSLSIRLDKLHDERELALSSKLEHRGTVQQSELEAVLVLFDRVQAS
jgi:hypothetical protein